MLPLERGLTSADAARSFRANSQPESRRRVAQSYSRKSGVIDGAGRLKPAPLFGDA